MELRPIGEKKHSIREIIDLNWIFEKPIEKIILIILIALGVWKLLELIFKLL